MRPLVAIVVLTCVACTSNAADPRGRVAAAGREVRERGSYRFAMTVRDAGGTRRIEGGHDTISDRSIVATRAGGGAPDCTWIRDGLVVYASVAPGARDGAPWVRAPADGSDAGRPPLDLDALGEVADVQEVANDQVRGHRTTRYRATLPSTALSAAARVGAGGRAPIDVWLDEAGLVHRMVWEPDGAASHVDLDLFDHGAPLEIAIPDPEATDDVGSVAQASELCVGSAEQRPDGV